MSVLDRIIRTHRKGVQTVSLTTSHCPHCNDTGWEDGPDEYETVNGQPHRYTTVVPCRHTRPTTREWTVPDA